MQNKLTKDERAMLLLCQQVGYGDIICSVKDGRLDMSEARVRESIMCNKEPWKPQYSGKGGEISLDQRRAIESIQRVDNDALVHVTVSGGHPAKVELLYIYKQQAQIA